MGTDGGDGKKGEIGGGLKRSEVESVTQLEAQKGTAVGATGWFVVHGLLGRAGVGRMDEGARHDILHWRGGGGDEIN